VGKVENTLPSSQNARCTRWGGGAGHRSPPSRVSIQWGVGGGRKSPLSRQNARWGVVMRRCPPSHTSTQWRGRDGRESPPSHRNTRREGWWVAETSPHSKREKVGLVDLRLAFRARERRWGGFPPSSRPIKPIDTTERVFPLRRVQ